MRRFLCLLLCLGLLGLAPGRAHAYSPASAGYPFAAAESRQVDPCADPANPVVAENCLPGSTDWIVENDLGDIEGFAYPPSVNIGEAVDFFVHTDAARYDIAVYRSGYYGGAGGRLVQTIDDLAGQDQPPCQQDLFNTGLTSCGNWSSSYHLEIPVDWVSGVYVAKLVRPDTGGESYLLFVVRDDARDSAILYQQSLFTYHAYDNYGGKSLIDFNSGECNTVTQYPRGAKVSLLRPYQGDMGLRANQWNSYFRTEYAMVRWLEWQGYDVTYSTTLDTHRSGLPEAHNELLDHGVFLSAGNDEYWTQAMDDAVTAARDAGVHLAFFSGNTSYWRVRLEPDPWTGEPDSVIVTYKTTAGSPPDPGGPTGTFRDPAGVNDPENGLTGVMFIGENDDIYFPMRVTAGHGTDRIYRHTDLQTMPPGMAIDLGVDVFGWDWAAAVDNGHSPEGLEILAETPVYGFLLTDAGNEANAVAGAAMAHTTRYVAASGSLVFASGTMQWSWGLGARGIEVVEPDPYIQQVTYNVLADMGAQPATPADGLILDGESGTITSPPEAFVALDSVSPPVISGVTVDMSASPLSVGRVATFSWQTDRATGGQLWVGPGRRWVGTEPRVTFTDYAESRTVTLDNLRPDSTYTYRILAMDEQGQAAFPDGGSFHTPSNLIVQGGTPVLDLLRAGQCQVQANPALAVGGGVGLVALVAGLFLTLRYLRRKGRSDVA